jgi:hypothetical protein
MTTLTAECPNQACYAQCLSYTQRNDTQQNEIQQNDTQQNDTPQNDSAK